MPLASMTGFARVAGARGKASWAWELRSVNSKGLDLRIRVPQGWDAVEQAARSVAQARLKRGAVQATLTLDRPADTAEPRVNEAALNAVLAAAAVISARLPDAGAPSIDALLAQRGVIEFVEPEETEDERAAVAEAMATDFAAAVGALETARAREGAALESILAERLAAISSLTAQADACPARTPEAIRARLAEQVEALLGTGVALDAARLHQEAALIATRADVREELDRLHAHVDAARALIGGGRGGRPAARFPLPRIQSRIEHALRQIERPALTAIGLELKAVVEQFREQVQNVE